MKTFILIIIVALAAFSGGVWYAREYTALPIQVPHVPTDSTSGTTSQPTGTTTKPTTTYTNATPDFIQVTSPLPGSSLGTTFTVSGKARGNWYFEASFPIEVIGSDGTRLLQIPVQAEGEWMTTEFVPFSTSVMLPSTYRGAATLLLHRDNPSGLPENDASVAIPITIR